VRAVFVRDELITATRARKYLATKRGAMSEIKVKSYALLMKSKRWRGGGHILLDEAGHLIGGKHLVSAIAATGLPQRVSVYQQVKG
jgi:hypothetical protein